MLMWLGMVSAMAQQEPSFSHYWALEPSFNPAAAGKEQKINVTGAYAMTMVGFEHNPRTMYVGGDMPLYLLNSYHGVGVQLFSDEIGLFSHQRLAVQYAYKQRRDKLYVCEDCGYTGPTQEDLYLHVNGAHPGSAFLKKTSKKLAALLQNKMTSSLQGNANLSEEEEK